MGKKRKFQLTDSQSRELLAAYNTCRDGATKIRYQAVRLYGQGDAVSAIQRIANCGRTSLMEWVQTYQQAGVAGLCDQRAGGNCAKLSPAQVAEVAERLHTTTPSTLFGPQAATPTGAFWTIPDLQRAVHQWYGVRYKSRSSLLALFARCGLSYQRPERVFKSQRVAQILAFEEQLEKKF